MPSKSQAQHNAMMAAAHGKSTLNIPKSVGKEYVAADKKAHSAYAKGGGAKKKQTMALTISQQYDAAIASLSEGDLTALEKILTNPDQVTVEENRTVAERMGLKRGFLSAAVNTAADPLVWVATLLSRKFPTKSWISGTIPKRFIGTANEFSGLALAARPTESMFRGTLLPKLSSLSMHRQAEVLKAAEPMWKVMERPHWKDEMPIVSLALEGANPAGLTPELAQVAATIRNQMDEVWHRFGRQSLRIHGGLDEGTVPTARPFPAAEAPTYLRDYLPHIPLIGNESTFAVSGLEALDRLGGKRNRAMAQAMKLGGASPWKLTEQDTLQSEFGNWQRWISSVGSEVYNPHLFRRQREGLMLGVPPGQDLFYTDLNLVLQKYVASMAKTYAISAPLSSAERAIASHVDEFGVRHYPTDEPIIVQSIRAGVEAAGAKVVRRRIKTAPGAPPKWIEQILPETGSPALLRALQTHTRALRGSMAEDQILFGHLFNRAFEAIDKAKAYLSPRQQAQLTDAVTTIGNQRDYRKRLDGITNWFYASTLGLNFKSAFNNMLQTVATTIPVLGVGDTMAGIREFAPRVRRFTGEIAGEMRRLPINEKGLPRLSEATRRAFQTAFPELVDQRLDIDPRLFDISAEAIQKRLGPNGRFIDKESLFQTLLAPFTGTELSNRAIAFYGGRHKIRHMMRTGEYPVPRLPDGTALSAIEQDALVNFEAGNIVNATQFRPGPGSRTVVQSMLPGPLRQFTTFPLRLANFMADSTVRGAMTEAQLSEMGTIGRVMSLNGRNLGTLARMALYAKIATNGMRDVLGIDLGSSLGLDLPFNPAPSNQILAPLPLPPAVSTLLGLVSATATRDIEKMQPLELPGGTKIPLPKTLFPAGVGLSRLFRVMNQFRPDLGGFVDDDERLTYRAGTKDAILQMLGIPLDKARRERQYLERLHALRQSDREYGRKLRMAAVRYDFAEMESIKGQYQEAFPDRPPLQVSQQDIARYEASQRKTRVQRMLDTLPGRMGGLSADIYDYDPDLVEPPQPLAGLLSAG